MLPSPSTLSALGWPLLMLLDLVEVLKLHIGANLAIVFAEVLEAFRIKEKVRITIESKEN